ncbi:MAG: hypothetical protein QXD62_00380 [Candidatus Woesearchaeota archaeon]
MKRKEEKSKRKRIARILIELTIMIALWIILIYYIIKLDLQKITKYALIIGLVILMVRYVKGFVFSLVKKIRGDVYGKSS